MQSICFVAFGVSQSYSNDVLESFLICMGMIEETNSIFLFSNVRVMFRSKSTQFQTQLQNC